MSETSDDGVVDLTLRLGDLIISVSGPASQATHLVSEIASSRSRPSSVQSSPWDSSACFFFWCWCLWGLFAKSARNSCRQALSLGVLSAAWIGLPIWPGHWRAAERNGGMILIAIHSHPSNPHSHPCVQHQQVIFHMGGSINMGPPKWMYYNWKSHWNWMLWGYPYFRKPPYFPHEIDLDWHTTPRWA